MQFELRKASSNAKFFVSPWSSLLIPCTIWDECFFFFFGFWGVEHLRRFRPSNSPNSHLTQFIHVYQPAPSKIISHTEIETSSSQAHDCVAFHFHPQLNPSQLIVLLGGWKVETLSLSHQSIIRPALPFFSLFILVLHIKHDNSSIKSVKPNNYMSPALTIAPTRALLLIEGPRGQLLPHQHGVRVQKLRPQKAWH